MAPEEAACYLIVPPVITRWQVFFKVRIICDICIFYLFIFKKVISLVLLYQF